MQDDLLPAIHKKQFLTGFFYWNSHSGKPGDTGFSAGDRKHIRLVLYDKLKEVLRKKSETLLTAMRVNRWGGNLPVQAMRVEYSVNGIWLRSRGISTLEQALARIPDLVRHLTQFEHRPVFAVTDAVPDRVNKHQSRVEILPEWKLIVETFQRLSGTPQQPLKLIRKETVNWKRLYQMLAGYLTKAASELNYPSFVLDDVIQLLEAVRERAGMSADYLEQKFFEKASPPDAGEVPF